LPAGATQAPAAASPPNFLLILVDDQARNSFKRAYMPQTFRRIVDHGTVFSKGLAAPPLCCPDRAGIITGQYPHNNGVFSNHPGYAELRDPSNTLPVWLHRAGYRTAIFGKFLNHYDEVGGASPAPGFDRWFEVQGSSYYGYRVSDDGIARNYGHRRRDYSTDVVTRKAAQFLRRTGATASPFFLWLAYGAPHVTPLEGGPCHGSNPDPGDGESYRRFSQVPLPRSDSFNERNVSDKPRLIRSLPRLGHLRIDTARRRWQCTLAAMSHVDKAVGRLMAQLRREGELKDTIVLYLSDNGLFFGEHRLSGGNGFSYEPALRVPYAVRVPSRFRSGPLARRVSVLASNQDIAPTLLDYATRYGRTAAPCASTGHCRRMDGHSLEPLLGGSGSWRGRRGVLAELDARPTGKRKRFPSECNCAYEAIRTGRYLFARYSTGEEELYDLMRDPDELRNRARSPAYAATEQDLAARLARLRSCSGVEGRDPPKTAPYCE
jgi:arylsulfatase A-like enzyme